MSFTRPIDIRKAAGLAKEVDLSISQLAKAIGDGDTSLRNRLVSSMSNLIEELEDFRNEYETDERAILFEKERLRLRRAVQDAANAAAAPPTPSSSSSFAAAAVPGVPSSSSAVAAASSTPMTKASKAKAGAEELSPRGLSLSALKTDGEKKRISSGAKASLHFEETKSSGVRGKITVDGTVFAPCVEPGMYVNDQLGEIDAATPEAFIDLQIVLNEAEMRVLASRLQQRRNPVVKDIKNALSSSSSLLATPYVDQSRLLKDLYRPVQSDKWTSPGGFRPNAK